MPLITLIAKGRTLVASFSFSARTYGYDQKPRKQPTNLVAAFAFRATGTQDRIYGVAL
jgi:hypothetical protein